MKSQSQVVSKKPLTAEETAGLCCDKVDMRKVSELGRGAVGRGNGEQKIPEWGNIGPEGCLGEKPLGEEAWSFERTQPMGAGRKEWQG